MSKKDFIALADMIAEYNRCAQNNRAYTAFTDDQIGALANFCQKQNGAFKRERWASYIEGKTGPNGGGR